MLEKIKNYLTTEVKFYVALFAVMAISGWIANGVYSCKFSMVDLVLIFGVVVANATGQHWIDSKYNSPQGVKPNDR